MSGLCAIINQTGQYIWTWPSSVVHSPAVLGLSSKPNLSMMQGPCSIWHASRKEVSCLRAWKWYLGLWTGRHSAVARGKKPGRSWFFPDSSFKPSPWPQLAPLSFRIITQSAVTKPLSADLPLPAEWGGWGLILGPGSNTCWLFDFTQITKLEIIPILQLRLLRKLIHFNYINTKCIFVRHVHEACHEKKSF